MKLFNLTRERWMPLSDAMATGLAVSLPWSTTLTVAFTWLYLASLLPNLSISELRRTFLEPVSALPTLLLLLAAIGMLWADVTWGERLKGLSAFRLVILIPGMILHFRYSRNAHWVLIGCLASCTALLVLSWLLFFFPAIPWHPAGAQTDVPVKDHITQCSEFIVCIFALIALGCDAWLAKRHWYSVVLFALAFAFLANILFVALSRTALLVLPVLLVLFGYWRFGIKGALALLVAAAVVSGAGWSSSSYLRERVSRAVEQAQDYERNVNTSVGLRLEFWRKSVAWIREAPVIGHGTGTVGELFQRDAAAEGPASVVTVNTHNQILTVALQLGILGAAILLAMWGVHLAFFWRPGFAAWIGLTVVVQNIISSMFNSHLFDFTQGLGYGLGVGVAAAVIMRERSGTRLDWNRVESKETGGMNHAGPS